LRRKLELTAVIALGAVIGLAGAATATAQTAGEPAGQPTVDVQQVLVPQTRGKLIRKGVLVQASCTPSCVLLVKLSVSPGTAAKLGLGGEQVGSGAAATSGDGVPTFIRVRLKRSVREALASSHGSANLQVKVTALS
jgi:hypothetical protein